MKFLLLMAFALFLIVIAGFTFRPQHTYHVIQGQYADEEVVWTCKLANKTDEYYSCTPDKSVENPKPPAVYNVQSFPSPSTMRLKQFTSASDTCADENNNLAPDGCSFDHQEYSGKYIEIDDAGQETGTVVWGGDLVDRLTVDTSGL